MSEKLLETDDKNLNKIQDDVVITTVGDDTTAALRSDKSCNHNGGSGGSDDISAPTKKKKTRRGKPKGRNNLPYTKLSWQQRKMQSLNRPKRSKVLAPGQQALAPYNSNQFLIEDHDHGYLKEIEDRLKTRIERLQTRQSRTRDSSFSIESDLDYYYSSPEDEEEFLTREFSNTYQDIRSERLNSMTREELMQECIQMENRLEMLTKCLRGKSPIDCETSKNLDDDDANVVPDIQVEIMKLVSENDQLRRENERLRKSHRLSNQTKNCVGSVSSSISSSVDSESDSSSESSSSESTDNNKEDKINKHVTLEQNHQSNNGLDYAKMNGVSSEHSDSPEDQGGGANNSVNNTVGDNCQ